MAHVSEHHTKEEWVSDNRENSWIGFSIVWNTVSIHNFLENSGYVIRPDKSRSLDIVVQVNSDLDS